MSPKSAIIPVAGSTSPSTADEEPVVVAVEPEAGPLVARQPVGRREVELDVEPHAPRVDVVDRRHAPLIARAAAVRPARAAPERRCAAAADGGGRMRAPPVARSRRIAVRPPAGCRSPRPSTFAPHAQHAGAACTTAQPNEQNTDSRPRYRRPTGWGPRLPAAARTPVPLPSLARARCAGDEPSPRSREPRAAVGAPGAQGAPRGRAARCAAERERRAERRSRRPAPGADRLARRR